MQPLAGQTRQLIGRVAAAAATGPGDILLQQAPAVLSLLQQIQQQPNCPAQSRAFSISADISFSQSDAVPASSLCSNTCDSSSCCPSSSVRSLAGHQPHHAQSIRNLQLPQQHHQQQQQRLCSTGSVSTNSSSNGKYSLAESLQYLQEQQQRKLRSGQPDLQPAQTNRMQQRSELDVKVAACTSISALAALLESRPAPREVATALNMLSKLNKNHRTLVKQQHRAMQQRWNSLRPLDEQQQQELQELQQQHGQHEQELRSLLTKLMGWLDEDQSSLSVEQLVHVLGCFGSLGGIYQLQQGPTLLLAILQRVLEGIHAVQPKHLSFLATSLGQLQDQERGISTHDDLPLPDATPSTDADSAPLSTAPSTSSSSAASHMQQQEVQAASEVLRMLVQEICNTVQLQGPAMNTTELANLVAAMARLGHYDWQMMRQVGMLVLRHTLAFNAGQVAKCLNGFTKLRHYDVELCGRLAEAAQRDMANASGVHVTQIVWALAHQRFEEAGVFEAASLQVPLRAHELQPRHVANLSWGFAVRKAYSPALYHSLGERMVQLLQMDRGAAGHGLPSSSSGGSGDSLFSLDNDIVLPHHLSLVAWSFAKQGHRHEQMMLAIADRAALVAGQMLPQNVSNAAWAFGSLGVQHPAMFDALASAAKAARLEGYNSQNITDLAWGFANAGHQDPELFDLIASASLSSLFDLSPHSLSDIITAYTRARDPQAEKVLAAAVPAVMNCMARFSVQMLADILCSYAEIGLKDDTLLQAAAQMLVLRMVPLEQDTDSQAKIIWTMKTLNWRDAELERMLSTLIPNLAELL